MTKPKYLYHASSNTEIDMFEPRTESARHPDEGPVVFGGEDKDALTVFLVPTTTDWVEIGKFKDENGNKFQFIVISDRKRFMNADKGGAIYKLPSTTFFINERFDLGTREWTSKVAVKPISKDRYQSGLKAMMDVGIQVYFVDKDIFKDIQQSKDHGYAIIKTLNSENYTRGINFIPLNF